jgi:hypothetical protein
MRHLLIALVLLLTPAFAHADETAKLADLRRCVTTLRVKARARRLLGVLDRGQPLAFLHALDRLGVHADAIAAQPAPHPPERLYALERTVAEVSNLWESVAWALGDVVLEKAVRDLRCRARAYLWVAQDRWLELEEAPSSRALLSARYEDLLDALSELRPAADSTLALVEADVRFMVEGDRSMLSWQPLACVYADIQVAHIATTWTHATRAVKSREVVARISRCVEALEDALVVALRGLRAP